MCVGRPARTYRQQLCTDTGCNLEYLPETMNDRDGQRERVRKTVQVVRHDIYIYIYIYIYIPSHRVQLKSFENILIISVISIRNSIILFLLRIVVICSFFVAYGERKSDEN